MTTCKTHVLMPLVIICDEKHLISHAKEIKSVRPDRRSHLGAKQSVSPGS